MLRAEQPQLSEAAGSDHRNPDGRDPGYCRSRPDSLDTGDPGGRRRVVAESRFGVTNAPLQAEVVQLVVDFPPGVWTSWHTHGGHAINLVLEGEITLRHVGMERSPRFRST